MIKALIFLLYFPIGIFLVVIRLFMGFHAIVFTSVVPTGLSWSKYLLRSLCVSLGVFGFEVDFEKRSNSCKVFVVNKCTGFDNIVLKFILGRSLTIPNTDGHSSQWRRWLTGYKDFGWSKGYDIFRDNVEKFTKVDVLLCQIDGDFDSNRNMYPFDIASEVQPLKLEASRLPILPKPFEDTSSLTCHSLFWSLFNPYTNYTLTYHSVVRSEQFGSKRLFAKHVWQLLSDGDDDACSNGAPAKADADGGTSSSDNVSLSSCENDNLGATADSQSADLAAVVKEVLPNISEHVIRQTLLENNNDVDVTIAQLVEDWSAVEVVEPVKIAPIFKDKFSRNSAERHSSLQKRKNDLLEHAREEYLKKC